MSAVWRTRLVRAMLVAVSVVTFAVSAGVASIPDTPAGAAGASATDRSDLPPAQRDEIAALFAKDLAALGLRTTRAVLQDRGSYRSSPRGTHLAIYVEPIDAADATARQRVAGIVPLARVFLPRVFRKWRGLESFDVCQEDAATPNSPAVPPPITQLALVRKDAAGIDWGEADLGTLVAAAAAADPTSEEGWGDPRHFYLYVGPEAQRVAAYRRARQAAGLPPSITLPTTTVTTSAPPP